MKSPFHSGLVCYRRSGAIYEAERELQFIVVREVKPTVRRLQDMAEYNTAFQRKLSACPFMVLDGEAVSATDIVSQWVEDDHPTIPSTLHVEDEVVYVNLYAPITHYEKSEGAYSFHQCDSVFCDTMCLPRTFKASSIGAIQKYRAKLIGKQMQSSRLLMGDGKSLACYNAHDFTLLNRVAGW